MKYENVCLEAFGYSLPHEIVTSDDLELRLSPLYERLRLPAGRLELMTGIRERRIWPRGMLPSEQSTVSGRNAIEAAGIDPARIGALIHGSVCRDHLEPATANRVHHELGLDRQCFVYDVSNACLGIVNGMLQIADLIELQRIQAGLVVGTEDSRHLLETTIAALNHDESLTRSSVKSAVASLTIGSGSCAVLLTHRSISRTGTQLLGAAVRAHTRFHQLCQSGRDEAVGDGMRPTMNTDSEQLMHEGIQAGVDTFDMLLGACQWSAAQPHKTCCHQVGEAHRRQMLSALGRDIEQDFATLRWLGNTGSVALPVTAALAAEAGHFESGDHIGLLGIGSGINCVMVGFDWQSVAVSGNNPHANIATSQIGFAHHK